MCYFKNAMKKTQITVDAICHELENPKFGEVDLIVGTGLSGTLLLSAIHLQSGIPFGAIRNNNDGAHSPRKIETGERGDFNDRETKRYVIIDDLTESGDTIDRIKIKMSGHECVGIIFYQSMNLLLARSGIFDGVPYVCLEQDIEEIEEEIVSVV